MTFFLPLPSSLLKLPNYFFKAASKHSCHHIWEFKEPRRRQQQERHKFAYLTMKNNSFARFARAFFIFGHFEDVLVLYTTWNDLFCSCVDDVSIWWQMFSFLFLPLKHWFQFNFMIVTTHFANVMTLNNWEMVPETGSYIFRWRYRRRVGLSSLLKMKLQRMKGTLRGRSDKNVGLGGGW